MNPIVVAAATLGSLTAGWLGRSELERRRRRRHLPPVSERLATIPAGNGNGWAYGAVRTILDGTETDEVCVNVTLAFASVHGGETAAGMDRGDRHPERVAIERTVIDGHPALAYHALEVAVPAEWLGGDAG